MQTSEASAGAFSQIDAWIAAGELEPAAAGLAALQKRYPDARPIYERFADVQRRRGDTEGAAATDAAARRLGYSAVFDLKRFMDSANRRINLLDAGGFYERSQVFFDALLELNPDSSGSLNNRAYALADQGVLLDRAVARAERAMQLEGKNPSDAVRDTLGWAYAKVQRNDEALAIFEQLVKEDRKSAVYQYHYGVVLGQLDRKQDATKAFDAALESKTITDTFRKTIEEARAELTKAPAA
jgi:tetratricopeptide (TPR) repeat protein